jgi:hypothetical protein
VATTFDGTFDSTFREATVSSITLSAGTRTLIQAYATKDDYRDSATAAKTITVYSGTVATPVISQTSGQNKFTIACETAEAVIRYTTDGTTPSRTVGSTYSGEVTAEYGDTIKAFAYKDYWLDSDVASQDIIIVELEDETTAYLAAMGASAPTDPDIIAAYDNLIKNLKAATVGDETVDFYAKLDALYLFYTAHNNADNALINVIDTAVLASLHDSNGTKYPSFAAKAGFSTDGTNYIDTKFNPSVAYASGDYEFSSQATKGSMAGMIQHSDEQRLSKYSFGASTAGAYMLMNIRTDPAGQLQVNHFSNAFTTTTLADSTSPYSRFACMSRVPADTNKITVMTENGTEVSGALAEGMHPNLNVYIGGQSTTGGAFSNGKQTYPAIWWAGSAITVAEWDVFMDIMNDYITAMSGV